MIKKKVEFTLGTPVSKEEIKENFSSLPEGSHFDARYDPARRAALSRLAQLEAYLVELTAASQALVFAIENAPLGWPTPQELERQLAELQAVLQRAPAGVLGEPIK